MADNFLEKQMEDYRRGVNKAPRRTHVAASAKGAFVPKPQRLLLLLENKELQHALLAELQGVGGIKTAFAGMSYAEGNKLAQATGALFVPSDIESETGRQQVFDTVTARWGAVDTVITDIHGLRLRDRTVRQLLISPDNEPHGTTDGNITEISLPEPECDAKPLDSKCDAKPLARLLLLLLTEPASMISRVTLR